MVAAQASKAAVPVPAAVPVEAVVSKVAEAPVEASKTAVAKVVFLQSQVMVMIQLERVNITMELGHPVGVQQETLEKALTMINTYIVYHIHTIQ